ncbi:YutD family protein [Liquorilactobacillus satsumensis]|uniref:YutD family protein n=1 Tax=Liquorilactobacillus satsumensis TaxID=259059 RepID=UPI001E381738|nr:YutD family protein [Liquorilactobacillus satsumensis]MCC7667405.1 transcriptional regulator [Liquorilactobacillus satsumensis]MCP9329516.1 DUF1027 domain-containing protein [Liquorilactobacillus satsumensis]MCP9358621.1 DUF1027 domain-containing protein [Liquorilactobacillus satsumensis]MCP9371773.1 DUF1027 domain-containing protein [Liquorilactobacillus satsumensis]
MDSEKKERREAQLAKKAETLKAYASDIKMQSKTELTIDGHPYVLVKDFKNAFQIERLEQRFSQILTKYDYIVGDWGYDQLRLHGFYAKESERGLPSQRIDHLDDYLYEYCNFGCAYFILQNLAVVKPAKSRRKKRGGAATKHSKNKKAIEGKQAKTKRPNKPNKQNKSKKHRNPRVETVEKKFEIHKRVAAKEPNEVGVVTQKSSNKRHFTIRQKGKTQVKKDYQRKGKQNEKV